MNVSKKVLVIIYIIFALLTSVIIFASQGILSSSFSHLEEKQADENAKNLKHIIDTEILRLDGTNSVLSSREDIRNFMLKQDSRSFNQTEFHNFFLSGGYDFVYFVDNSGNVTYFDNSDLSNVSKNSTSEDANNNLKFESPLLNNVNAPVRGFLIFNGNPSILSCQPVFSTSEGKEPIGKIILGIKLDPNFLAALENLTGKKVGLYQPHEVPSELRKSFFEKKNETFTTLYKGNRGIGYFVFEDLNGNSGGIIETIDSNSIYAEGRKALRYIVIFLLFSGVVIGAGCKHLLDKEVVSRIVAIEKYVDKVGKNEDYSPHHVIDGDDELSRLNSGINRMLDRLEAASNKVKAQEHEKKVILNSLSEHVIFVDLQLKIVWANKASLDYMGLKLEEVAGREYEKVFATLEDNQGKCFLRKALESGNEKSGEITTSDGRVWAISASLIKDEQGKITGLLQTGLDITVHKRSEEKLIQAKLEAEAASRTKSEFLANMSHELRTPLNSIIGFSDILLEQVFGELNERQLKYINNISTSGKHLLELINDILDLSKVEAGKMELHYSEFSINAVFAEVRTVLTPLAQEKSLEIDFNIESVETLEADRSRLLQILYNLVSNAVKFTPEGGKVSVLCKKSGNRGLISVTDTGIGISPEDQKKLFQPFMQLDASTSKQYCGTGLGLALVKKIVALHEGDIWVESDIEKGSTFTFAIPLIKPPETKKGKDAKLDSVILEFELNKAEALSVKESVEHPREIGQLPEIHYSEKEDAKQELVLIVEDDKNSSDLLSIVLRDAGYSVALLSNGRNVSEVVKKLKPGIITLDVFLPDINGWLVLKQLKNDPLTASIPVLIISMTNSNELGIALGATYSFTKPVKRVELIESLKEIVKKFQLEDPKILIIDDDENTVELLNSMIESEKFEVIKAYSGKEGVEKLFLGQKPDILILELLMSEVSGFEVISSLRVNEKTKNIPIIVCTSGEFTEKKIEELNNELKGYLISILKKGTFGRKELINRIKQLAMLKRLNNEGDSNCRR
ncbi:MAG: response regulator [Methanosarcina sp.]